jgi:hypothetical protein
MLTFERSSLDESMLSNNPLGGDNPRKTKQELLGLDPKQDKIPAPKIDEMPQEIEKSQIRSRARRIVIQLKGCQRDLSKKRLTGPKRTHSLDRKKQQAYSSKIPRQYLTP